VTVFWLKIKLSGRRLRRVTQPPHIAGPLAHMAELAMHRDLEYYLKQ